MANTLDDDLNIVSNSGLEIELLGDDLNIIQALDDEPNDVGGLTSAELKATFDKAGNLIKTYLNEKLVPAILAADATEAARAAAEDARKSAETARGTAETARAAAEKDRVDAENAREDAELRRQREEEARQTAEQERASAEADRALMESHRQEDEQARNAAETDRELNESNRIEQENGRIAAEKARVEAEKARAEAESARVEAEQARADETAGIVARASRSEDNAEAWAHGGYVSEEDADGMIQDTPVPGAKWYAEKADACANGGSYDPDPTDGTAERQYTSGAKNMADKAKAFAEGGSYKEYVADTSAPGTYNLVTKTVADAESAKGYAQRAEQAAIKQPIIKNGTWWVWDADSGAYTDTGVLAGGSGGGTSDQVFIAEYDVTTNADLLAAYQSGKVCFVKYGDQYVPVTIVQADYNSNFVLKGYIIIAESVPGVYVNEVNQTVIVSRYDTGWSIGNRALSIDDALSETSENPVQNKVIKSALDAIHVPDKLPNPNALTFTGAVTGTYDGSAPLEVAIPSGGDAGKRVRHIATVSVTEGTTRYDVTVDSNGDALNLESVYIFTNKFWGSNGSYIQISINRKELARAYGQSGSPQVLELEKMGELQKITNVPKPSDVGISFGDYYNGKSAVTSVRFWSPNSTVDTTIEIYGVDA